MAVQYIYVSYVHKDWGNEREEENYDQVMYEKKKIIIILLMIILSKQPKDKIMFYMFTNTTVNFITYKRAGLCSMWNEMNSAS